jgi:hypothetical protein
MGFASTLPPQRLTTHISGCFHPTSDIERFASVFSNLCKRLISPGDFGVGQSSSFSYSCKRLRRNFFLLILIGMPHTWGYLLLPLSSLIALPRPSFQGRKSICPLFNGFRTLYKKCRGEGESAFLRSDRESARSPGRCSGHFTFMSQVDCLPLYRLPFAGHRSPPTVNSSPWTSAFPRRTLRLQTSRTA